MSSGRLAIYGFFGRHFGARSAVSVDRTGPIKHNTSLMCVSVQKALRCKTYNILSKRRATLETIKDKGETVIWNRRP